MRLRSLEFNSRRIRDLTLSLLQFCADGRWEFFFNSEFPTHSPTHKSCCLIRLPRTLAVPAVLSSRRKA
jgi:hypothetical protein